MAVAIEDWVEAHGDRLYRAASLMGGEAEAADLCQEVFLVATRRAGSFEGRSAVYTWLYGILRNVVRDRRRRKRATPEPPLPASSPEAQAGVRQDRARLRVAIDGLPEAQQVVVTLFYLEENSLAQVAALLEVPEGTVKSRLFAARRALRVALEGGA